MSDHFKNLLNSLDAQMSGKSMEEKRDRAAEDVMVGMVLKHFGIEVAKRLLREECRRDFGSTYLRFEAFLALYPSFPISLHFRRTKRLFDKVNAQSLFTNFSNLPFMDSYSELLDTLPDDFIAGKPIALVMPWKALPGGMTLHNCEVDQESNGTRLLWVYRAKKKKAKTQRLVLEPLTSLMRSIGRWSPEA